jgi:hypothetical protein
MALVLQRAGHEVVVVDDLSERSCFRRTVTFRNLPDRHGIVRYLARPSPGPSQTKSVTLVHMASRRSSRSGRGSRTSRPTGRRFGNAGTATAKKTFALVPGHGWLVVDRVAGHDYDGRPWFIGVGMGFDIGRILVYASNEGDAEEIAEEKWPERMGTKIARKDEEEAEESGRGTFFSKGHMWFSSEDIRIFTVAARVEKGVSMIGGDAKLTTGEVIRYT